LKYKRYEEMLEDKEIANMLIEKYMLCGHNSTEYFFELQAVKTSLVSCDLSGQEYN
jgi:hypothetical protein